MIKAVILVVVIVLAVAVGLALRARSGKVRPSGGGQTEGPPPATDAPGGAGRPDDDLALLRAAGLHGDGPAVVHFSASWCGPCAAVRRVVAGTVGRLAEEDPAGAPVQDLELDLDEHTALARRLHVMSLPTTFLYRRDGSRHGRISGVPDASALADALRSLR
ncbi:thioredoxin family protein [Tomitella cavernea]|uniref:Thioredoxin family protein n=1 Tax=Tomitella cavernea TaxID=1387982 RepID=A0ABP9CKG1_9ACTN|nr:thioredoxin family protein [Tomitella cavernea]